MDFIDLTLRNHVELFFLKYVLYKGNTRLFFLAVCLRIVSVLYDSSDKVIETLVIGTLLAVFNGVIDAVLKHI